MKPFFVNLGQLSTLAERPDANLLLIKPGAVVFSEFKVIPFSSRLALEKFNQKAGLKPVVFSIVPRGCAIYKHQKESV